MSTQTYALLFYGFPVEGKDILNQSFEPWELVERISDAGLGRKVRCVSYGPFDDYSQALAIYKPFIQVDADSLVPCRPIPERGAALMARWDETLKKAAETLGVTFKKPGLYVAPWRF